MSNGKICHEAVVLEELVKHGWSLVGESSLHGGWRQS